ncbi:CHAD domain-containing protein [Parahaliea mediterranea]|uniref:CHAD domain-containing protein n=1 Tax=Parahaliea mediterranea TaxID=651086 RepID=A0A939DHP2_9GAMM|nr:CHAD domain-containing protein [Parahaliea mediterranea]MBN7797667.1 CHAD domain-containing protein [Parahaliea mediterranea]
MAFALKPHRNAAKEVRRIARQQVDRGLGEIGDDTLSAETAVHQVRKRCKKMRALLRLVADELGDEYALENRWYRDTARLLSDIRDTQQAARTRQSLAGADAGEGVSTSAADIRAREALAQCADRLREGRERIARWPLQSRGFEILRPGLLRMYRRGKRQMKTLRRGSEPGDFHQWRKVVKYHGYHLKLLRPLWPAVLRTHYREAARLGELLGDEHDLLVLARRLELEAADSTEDGREQALAELYRRSRALRSEALRLGARVYAEKPGLLGRRLREYWRLGRSRP